ncbi:hypothetical protein [methane-oxidizing endosymbiont of Gigantopelta aegis]|uniref:hypothetical protein n=1 Tax=methane-oxidizing endosymbiont of Gigantopelta aegis TaxID=2794938 RepID=UPI0018DE023F|nr:hypothetical protein [methane-oxidizing endosymbiont of Gigantopelta aegis]
MNLNANFERFDSSTALGIKVTGNNGALRTHNVYIYQSADYCIFIAQAVPPDIINQLHGKQKEKKIIEYTWVRNRHADVVDFFLDEHGNISGRIIHPATSLDWEEFIFYIYILAVEADRLEYVFSQEDIL